jgi:acyl carrier protein
MPIEKQIENFIIDFFSERGKLLSLSIEERLHTDFLKSNTLDSIEFISLIAEIEGNFDLLFIESDIQSPQFSSITGIVTIACERIKKS